MQREEYVTVQREMEYSCNLEGFKEKVKTLMGIKAKARSPVPNLLVKLSQVLSPWTYAKFGPNHVKFLCSFLLFCLGIASFLYNSFLLHVLHIVTISQHRSRSWTCTTVGVITRLLV